MAFKDSITLTGRLIDINDALRISRGAHIGISPSLKKGIVTSEQLVKKKADSNTAYYGINTGFGYLANTRIDKSALKMLQRNIIVSHASGWGPPLSPEETRLAMTLRLNVLVQGYTGVRYALCKALQNLINANILPIIPEYGSVGASGDLAPLAHLALPLIGEGMVLYKDSVMPASQALKLAKLKPIVLAEKEGLSLVNGTQVMLAIGSLALAKAKQLLELADLITALTYEGLVGRLSPLDARIHTLRNQAGQILSAKTIRTALKGSYLHGTNTIHKRVQDPYSIRCAPQVHGASRDAISYACSITERELNAITDNPLVFTNNDTIVSGGNFHGQPLGISLDTAAIAIAELGNISERRLELLLNPNMSGLNAFLSHREGLDSGYMATQYLSASLVNENKLLANPASTDSIPGNVGIEDHVSMGMTSARKLRQLVKNTAVILAIELIAAAQAIDMRGINKLGQGTKKLYTALRSVVPMLKEDRIVSDDIAVATELLNEWIRTQ